MQLTRREIMVATGAMTGAMAARAAGLSPVILAGSEDGESKPIERIVMTLCRQCPGGCGLRVRVVNDCVVGVAGNPDHPINHGGVCARAAASVQTLYNPDRLTQPAVLAGPKGSGRFSPIAWPEAIKRLAERLATVRRAPGPHSVAVVTNGDRGLTRLLWSRFLRAYGSNNLIDWSSPEGHNAYPAIWAMQGLKTAVGYDLAESRYVLSFGSQWLDAHWSPVQASSSFSASRSGKRAVRPRFVNVEPRLSLTGAKADEWIPIRPGTEGALALGMAHVLLREDLYDHEFVEHHCSGFDDPVAGSEDRIGFRRLALRDYAPAGVAKITGVEEGTIFRLAREFATHKPAIALGFDGSGVSAQRCCDRMAIHALNALVGSIDVPGGVTHFQDIELLSRPISEPDAVAKRGLARPPIDQADFSAHPLGDIPARRLADRILADVPHPIEVLVLAGANPVFDCAFPERMKLALSKVPLVVSLSPWLDDSARWADLVVPDEHFLQRWDLDVCHTLTGEPAVSLGHPAVPKAPESRGSADVILELARAIGGPVSAALPFENAEAVIGEVCDTLFASGRGSALGPLEDVGWTRLMERSGWRPPMAASSAEFRQKAIQNGGWSDPIYYHRQWDRVFRSPAQRFAFHSAVIAAHVKPRTVADDIRCMPHYEPALGDDPSDTFPLRLYIYPIPPLGGDDRYECPLAGRCVRGPYARTMEELGRAEPGHGGASRYRGGRHGDGHLAPR